jgi:hypothetical protein
MGTITQSKGRRSRIASVRVRSQVSCAVE